MGFQLRTGSSGPFIKGTEDGQVLVWNATTGLWDLGTGGGEGSDPLIVRAEHTMPSVAPDANDVEDVTLALQATVGTREKMVLNATLNIIPTVAAETESNFEMGVNFGVSFDGGSTFVEIPSLLQAFSKTAAAGVGSASVVIPINLNLDNGGPATGDVIARTTLYNFGVSTNDIQGQIVFNALFL